MSTNMSNETEPESAAAVDLELWKELCEKATPEFWVFMDDPTYYGEIRALDEHSSTNGKFECIAVMPDMDDRPDDFRFIAYSDPRNVKHIISALEEAVKALVSAESYAYAQQCYCGSTPCEHHRMGASIEQTLASINSKVTMKGQR